MLARLNFLLVFALIVSGLYLVRVSHQSRRLFAEIESAHDAERQLETDRRRLEAERQMQATHLRVESTARAKLGMRSATPGNTVYVVDAGLAATTSISPSTGQPRRASAAGPASPVDTGASR